MATSKGEQDGVELILKMMVRDGQDKVELILKLMAQDEELADTVLVYLNIGMWDEWNVDLLGGIKMGFGGPELRIAAFSGLSRYLWEKKHQPEGNNNG